LLLLIILLLLLILYKALYEWFWIGLKLGVTCVSDKFLSELYLWEPEITETTEVTFYLSGIIIFSIYL
jgi:hypothetical protein